mmetsp:Transcript_71684/g.171314  ORF Transcript_71684/g.171314 Transcript_71684/m.171314 type:complete len:204 (-) Transcript_71684:1096-1707(-)
MHVIHAALAEDDYSCIGLLAEPHSRFQVEGKVCHQARRNPTHLEDVLGYPCQQDTSRSTSFVTVRIRQNQNATIRHAIQWCNRHIAKSLLQDLSSCQCKAMSAQSLLAHLNMSSSGQEPLISFRNVRPLDVVLAQVTSDRVDVVLRICNLFLRRSYEAGRVKPDDGERRPESTYYLATAPWSFQRLRGQVHDELPHPALYGIE